MAAVSHLQNVIGQAPVFNEVFIDEGDVDMAKAIKAYKDAGFTGVMTPDHTPHVSAPYIKPDSTLRCPVGLSQLIADGNCVLCCKHRGPWHAGIAFAVGYIKAAAKSVGVEFERGNHPDRDSTAVGQPRL